MQIGPEEIDVELPRAVFGGLKQGPTEQLLRRVAGDYALLYEENRNLKATLERMQQQQQSIEPVRAPQLELAAPTPPPPGQALEVAEHHVEHLHTAKDTDELSRMILASAQRTAREMRESARLDCEAMLKKASTKARELEREGERVKSTTEVELEEIEELRRKTLDQMRASLQLLLKTP